MLPIRLFVYGTLKRGFRWHFMLENSRYIDNYILSGYSLKNYVKGKFPFMIKGTDKVLGEIYEITDKEDWQAIQSLEQGYDLVEVEPGLHAFVMAPTASILNLPDIKPNKFGVVEYE